ncbi:restriction endonuclease [Macrococcoides canis]|uniref:restriction endonuclease n=1 Tax=Macrococcoides canis TaxID=1855823 RepID=UPI00165DED8A|nr:restriction endonuclease [Macrococcus canis]QNR07898.1 hypothetical protein GL258_06365 [Macrococcus canis]
MELANQRDWNLRVSAAPRIPRGEHGYPNSLKIILENLQNGTPLYERIYIPGSNADNDLEKLLTRIRPLGIVKKINSNWVISEEGLTWLNNRNNKYLTSLINGNLKFFIEIIEFCKKEHNIQEIIQHAKVNYEIDWKSKSQILDRIQWLKDLELIEYKKHKQAYQTTIVGEEILKYIKPIKLNIELHIEKELNINLSDLAIKSIICDQELLKYRKESTGYIPGGLSELFTTIFEGLEFINLNSEEKLIYDYYENSYGIKSTSTRSFLHHLVNLNLIERAALTTYELTDYGYNLLNTKNILDLIVYYNNTFKFVIELLFELIEPKTRIQLIEIANLSYGMKANISNNISHRLYLFEKAGLIYFYKNKFHLTKGIEEFLTYFSPEKSILIDLQDSNEINNEHFTLLNDLIKTSRDSMHPTNFEKSIRNIFLGMGFDAKLIGGSGNTDVLLKSPGSAQYSYTVCIDAKTTYSGPVTDSLVDFDTLKEHKKKHKADYIVIVANSFSSDSRLVKRAQEHKVALLDIELLSILYKKHIEIPISFDEYINIFNQNGIVNINVLDEKREDMKKIVNLMILIMNAFIENKDELLTSRDLYWIINVNKDDNTRFNKKEIEDMLLFLSSPFIASLERKSEGYRALGSTHDLKQKLNFFMKNI